MLLIQWRLVKCQQVAGRKERLEEEGDDVTCPVSISNYPTESKKGPKHGEDLNKRARSIRLGQDLQLSGNSC